MHGCNGVHGIDPSWVVVEARDVVEMFATGVHKGFLRFLRNFF